jgi:hypothetical protein
MVSARTQAPLDPGNAASTICGNRAKSARFAPVARTTHTVAIRSSGHVAAASCSFLRVDLTAAPKSPNRFQHVVTGALAAACEMWGLPLREALHSVGLGRPLGPLRRSIRWIF